MDERFNQTYRDRANIERYVGDPFSGVPVDQNLVEEVATEYSLKSDHLARSLREIERSRELLNVEILYSGFDPIPLGKDGDGHLFLTADAASCWDAVAERLTLTSVGRDAVATAHDRHVRRYGRGTDDTGVGFVVTCPEFPSAIIEDIQRLVHQTPLSARQATVWMLNQHALNVPAIADILSVPETVVRSELVEVNNETERVTTAARLLDLPNIALTRTKPNPTSDHWMGIEWSPWHDLHNRESLLTELPKEPGLYRVRHTGVEGLLYIGETGSEGGIRDRVGHGLAVGLNGSSRPDGGNHDATPPLWKIASNIKGRLEVSFSTPAVAANKRHRLALEATLVAVCRREIGRTPSVMLNRDPLPEEMTRTQEGGQGQRSSLRDESYSVPSWRDWRAVASPEWLGYEWTSPRPLSDRSEVESSKACAFRVWKPQSETSEWERVLTVVGTTESLHSRLFTLRNEYGPEMRFTIAELPDLSDEDVARSRELEEVRYDLVGAHYLTSGQPPENQY
jgi:hypothetical protein